MKKLLFSIYLLLTASFVFAQQLYTIKAIDAKTGSSIENASAIITAIKKGATTNAAGTLTIQAKEGDEVQISSIGYTNKTIQLGSNTTVEVLLVADQQDLQDVVVLGTRGTPRAKTETAVPIDVIKINQVGTPTAKMDLTSVLNMAAPSFNYNKQTVMLAPATGFYSTPGLGKQEVRLAYVINVDAINAAMDCLEKALEEYPEKV